MRIYIPSNWGDVQLVRDGERSKVIFKDLTTFEQKGMTKFLEEYRLECGPGLLAKGGEVTILESLAKAHKKFLKAFKPGKQIINAVKIADGKLEIVKDFKEKEGAGVSVERLNRHCPPPVVEAKEARAQVVLKEFLSTQQWGDFEKNMAFVSRGNAAGRRYIITSRWNPVCKVRGLVFCIDTKRAFCANLQQVPPAEEMLACKITIECDEVRFLNN